MNSVSIIIPTKNGEKYLKKVINNIFLQKNFSVIQEIIAIDSGSTDRTLQILYDFDIKIISISPLEFNHGTTRNLAIQNSKGNYIIFLSQDAIPFNNEWLINLITPLEQNQDVAGVYSKQIPREDCHIMECRQIVESKFYGNPDIPKFYSNQTGNIFFTNTSSCIRRSVWEQIPFKKVICGEDIIWAHEVIKAGLQVCYDPNSVVIHSHSYNYKQNLMRNFENSYILKTELKIKNSIPLLCIIFVVLFEMFMDLNLFMKKKFNISLITSLKLIKNSFCWQLSQFIGSWLGTHSCLIPKMKNKLMLQTKIIENQDLFHG